MDTDYTNGPHTHNSSHHVMFPELKQRLKIQTYLIIIFIKNSKFHLILILLLKL